MVNMESSKRNDPSSDESLASFLEALRSIPNDEKGAYLTALVRCPKPVQTESSVSSFLRHDKGDVENAARRFVDYWEKRKTVFGHHRAFLPMTLSKGAMSESCIALIRAGWVTPLPPDESGKRVCFLDMTIEEIRYQHSHEDRLQCLFYALSVLAEDVNSQTLGFTLIILYNELCYAPKSAMEGFEEILRVMPVQVTDLHLIPSGKMEPHGDFFEEFVPRALKTLLSSNESDHDRILDTRQHIYAQESLPTILKRLEESGLKKEYLPAVIGGFWSAEHHNAWLKLRLTKEDELSRTTTGLHKVFFPDSASTTGVSLSSSVRRRRREAKHSRQKRDRKRCRVKSLLLHIRHLEQEQRQHKADGKRLVKGLAEAKAFVEKLSSQGECLNTSLALNLQQVPTLAHYQNSVSNPSVTEAQLRAFGIIQGQQATSQNNVHALQHANELLRVAAMQQQQQLSQHALAISASGPVSIVLVRGEDYAAALNASSFPLPSHNRRDPWGPSSRFLNNLPVDRLMHDSQAHQNLLDRARQQEHDYAQLLTARNLQSVPAFYTTTSLFR